MTIPVLESPAFRWGVVLAISVIAAITDVRTRRISNLLTLPALALGLVVAALTGGVTGVSIALLASVVVAFPCLMLFVFAGGGAGDVKLMAAVGAWLGLIHGVVALLCVALAGVVIAMLFALARRAHPVQEAAKEENGPITMPYGLAICAGLWAAATGVVLWQF